MKRIVFALIVVGAWRPPPAPRSPHPDRRTEMLRRSTESKFRTDTVTGA